MANFIVLSWQLLKRLLRNKVSHKIRRYRKHLTWRLLSRCCCCCSSWLWVCGVWQPDAVEVQVWVLHRPGPSAAGCPVGCLQSYTHAVDVRSRGGEREEWLKTDGDPLARKRSSGSKRLSGVFHSRFRCRRISLWATRTPSFFSAFVCHLMGQRKRKKTAR